MANSAQLLGASGVLFSSDCIRKHSNRHMLQENSNSPPLLHCQIVLSSYKKHEDYVFDHMMPYSPENPGLEGLSPPVVDVQPRK